MIILFNEGFDQEFGNEKILIEKSFLEKVFCSYVTLHNEKRTSYSGSACIRNRFIMNKVC